MYNKAACDKYYASHRQQRIEHAAKWRKAHPEKPSVYAKKRAALHPEEVKAEKIRERKRNKDRYQASWKRYREENRDACRERDRRKMQKRRETRVDFRIMQSLRMRVYNTLPGKRETKSARTIELIGCSIEQLQAHLESQFKPGMFWDNYGLNGWHIDHIRPCASFNLTDPMQQRVCFNYKNLQPLWAIDNLRKGAKIGINS